MDGRYRTCRPCKVTDENGDEFLKRAIYEWGYKSGAEANLFARDRCSVLMAQKERSGRVLAHLEDADPGKWEDKGFRYSLTVDRRFLTGSGVLSEFLRYSTICLAASG